MASEFNEKAGFRYSSEKQEKWTCHDLPGGIIINRDWLKMYCTHFPTVASSVIRIHRHSMKSDFHPVNANKYQNDLTWFTRQRLASMYCACDDGKNGTCAHLRLWQLWIRFLRYTISSLIYLRLIEDQVGFNCGIVDNIPNVKVDRYLIPKLSVQKPDRGWQKGFLLRKISLRINPKFYFVFHRCCGVFI